MPASGEDAPGSTGPGSFGARQAYDSADKYGQGETDQTGPDNGGRGRIVPSPQTRRHPVTGQFTDRHPHDVHKDVSTDLAQRQAQEAVQRTRDVHALRHSEDHRFE
jgi:hypothetical protein